MPIASRKSESTKSLFRNCVMHRSHFLLLKNFLKYWQLNQEPELIHIWNRINYLYCRHIFKALQCCMQCCGSGSFWRAGSGSGSAFGSASAWKVVSESVSASNWKAGSGSWSTWCGSATLAETTGHGSGVWLYLHKLSTFCISFTCFFDIFLLCIMLKLNV